MVENSRRVVRNFRECKCQVAKTKIAAEDVDLLMATGGRISNLRSPKLCATSEQQRGKEQTYSLNNFQNRMSTVSRLEAMTFST